MIIDTDIFQGHLKNLLGIISKNDKEIINYLISDEHLLTHSIGNQDLVPFTVKKQDYSTQSFKDHKPMNLRANFNSGENRIIQRFIPRFIPGFIQIYRGG